MDKEAATLLLEQLTASPALPRYVDTLQALLTDERARRERFYDEMTEQRKVEFINGEIYMHSLAKLRHTNVVKYLVQLLGTYVDQNGLGWVGFEKTLICLTRNDYEPDVLFFGPEKAALLQPTQMKFPAPDFVVEVLSPSTEGHDRYLKFEDYAAHGIAEYWIIDPVAEHVEQYTLPPEADAYILRGTWDGDVEIVSPTVPGFRLPVRALFDAQANLAALKRLLAL